MNISRVLMVCFLSLIVKSGLTQYNNQVKASDTLEHSYEYLKHLVLNNPEAYDLIRKSENNSKHAVIFGITGLVFIVSGVISVKLGTQGESPNPLLLGGGLLTTMSGGGLSLIALFKKLSSHRQKKEAIDLYHSESLGLAKIQGANVSLLSNSLIITYKF